MRIHELAKQIGKESKDVIAWMNANGIEGKTASSSVDDNVAEKVKNAFTAPVKKAEPVKSAEPEKKAEPAKSEASAAPAKENAAPARNEENRAAGQENRAAGQERRPAAAGSQNSGNGAHGQANGAQKKKRPSIIIVGGNAPRQNGGNRQGRGDNSGRPSNNNGNRNGASERYIPIKSSVKSTQVDDVPYEVRQRQMQERKEAERRASKEAVERKTNEENTQTAVQETAAKPEIRTEKAPERQRQENRTEGRQENRFGNRQEGRSEGRTGYRQDGRSEGRTGYRQDGRQEGRNDNRQGGFSGRQNNGERKEDRRSSGAPSRDNNRFGNSDRNGRPSSGSDNRFRKDSGSGFAQAAPATGKENSRRDPGKSGKDKDRNNRSKKDHIYEDEDVMKSSAKKAGRFIKPEKKEEVVEEQIKVITLPETITLKDLADKMKMQPSAIIKKLFLQGQILTVNSEISYEEAENIAIDYDIICEKEVKVDVIEELLKEDEEDESLLVSRPPVICVMGHVDHGKTSLLDAIRKTNVTDKEAGGITQAIGAYTVMINGRSITFLDTPGHEAFTAMRMRGANSTDIAVLVVAADDGVMPQTVEAINHAKAAGIEIIVAINKIDKPSANVDRVKQELTEYELIPVDWGGNTEFVNVSAKSGEGIDDLLETIILTADIMELKANPNRNARGLIIEAELDKGRGPVATVLVQKGTLHVGDFISAGASYGKVRAMIDDKGKRVKTAGPSTPVEILGLSDVPSAGEVFIVHENDKTAKSYAETYQAQHREELLSETRTKMSLDDLFSKIQEGNLKELNIIVKADVQGSVEALKTSLLKLSNEEVVVKCIHGGVGAINESDVILASASNAIIIGFNVRPDAQAKATGEREGVDIRLYRVIYQAIDDIEAAMKGMLDPVFEEKVIGHAEIRQIFKASALGNIGGSYVLDGEVTRGCKVRITREGEQIFDGDLKSLKRFKDDVKEVKAGFECGLVFDGFDQIQELDQVEAYIMVEVPR